MRATLLTRAGSLAAAGAAGAATHVRRLTPEGFPLRNKAVFLDRKAGIFLIQVARRYTDRRGAVAFIVGPLKKATQYVLVYKGNANFAPSHSRFVTARA